MKFSVPGRNCRNFLFQSYCRTGPRGARSSPGCHCSELPSIALLWQPYAGHWESIWNCPGARRAAGHMSVLNPVPDPHLLQKRLSGKMHPVEEWAQDWPCVMVPNSSLTGWGALHRRELFIPDTVDLVKTLIQGHNRPGRTYWCCYCCFSTWPLYQTAL